MPAQVKGVHESKSDVDETVVGTISTQSGDHKRPSNSHTTLVETHDENER